MSVRLGLSAEHGEDGGVLARLSYQAKYSDRCGVELVLVPGQPLVSTVVQGVGVPLCLEILDSHDNPTMITNIVVIIPLQDLVPRQPSICREEDTGLVVQVVPHVPTGQHHARRGTAGQDRDGPGGGVLAGQQQGYVQRTGQILQ